MLRGFVGIVWFKQNRGLIAARCQMTINAVCRYVQRAVFIPTDIYIVIGEGGIFDLGVGLDPIKALALFTPECLGIGNGGLVHCCVFICVNMRASKKVREFRSRWQCSSPSKVTARMSSDKGCRAAAWVSLTPIPSWKYGASCLFNVNKRHKRSSCDD